MSLYIPSFVEALTVSRAHGRNSEAPWLWNGVQALYAGLQGGGKQWYDLSGYDNHGTLINGPTWVVGEKEWALDVAAGTQHILVPATMLGGLTGNTVTVSAWIYPDAFTSFSAVFDGGAAGATRQLSLFIDSVGVGYVAAAVNAGAAAVFSPAWTIGEWQHCTFVSDGANILTYRNAVQNSSTPGTVGAGFSAITWQIGGNPTGGGSNFNGKYANLAVHDGILALSEIQQLAVDPHAVLRVRRRVVAAAAGGFQAAWAQGLNQYIGLGV